MRKCATPIALIIITSLALTACIGLPSNYSMDQFIKSKAGDEQIERVERNEHGNYVEFEYRSLDRDLTFLAYGESTEGKNLLTDGADMKTNYATVIKSLYIDDIADVLCDQLDASFRQDDYDYETLYYFDCELFDINDADTIIDAVFDADAVYNQELEFHDAEWLKNNHAATLKVLCYKPDGSSVFEMIYINGSNTESAIRDLLEHGCS